ncbi:MAG: hypothetical protein CMI54_00770 [Parcubacteria group bacterium]|nr:hypothetical protein [Parcubacteria group bacterium]|tara:strand:+ start:6216 stop:6416 length:201 start_codon:yes stop_codon:yes gene_type:complete
MVKVKKKITDELMKDLVDAEARVMEKVKIRIQELMDDPKMQEKFLKEVEDGKARLRKSNKVQPTAT